MRIYADRARGFTLTEILVVVAIVALLTAILLPVFSTVRANARSATCQSNLRQLGLAISQYVQDYDGQHPPDSTLAGSSTPAGWGTFISTYTKNADIFHCPSEFTTPYPALLRTGYSDYGYNKYVLGLPEPRMVAPANTILILDCVREGLEGWDNGTDETYFDCQGDSTNPGATPGVATWLASETYAKRHSGGANYLFADGHVKGLKPASVFNNCTAPVSSATFAYK